MLKSLVPAALLLAVTACGIETADRQNVKPAGTACAPGEELYVTNGEQTDRPAVGTLNNMQVECRPKVIAAE